MHGISGMKGHRLSLGINIIFLIADIGAFSNLLLAMFSILSLIQTVTNAVGHPHNILKISSSRSHGATLAKRISLTDQQGATH